MTSPTKGKPNLPVCRLIIGTSFLYHTLTHVYFFSRDFGGHFMARAVIPVTGRGRGS
jgi:hypothetical protein